MRAWAVGRANPFFGMFIVNTSLYFITYKVLSCLRNNVVLSKFNYYCRSTTSELLIVPIGLDILTEFTIIFIVTVYFCISMSGE